MPAGIIVILTSYPSSMIGKEKIKFVRSLHQKKFRQKYNKFIAEGPKIVRECMTFCPAQIETIYALPAYIQTLDSQSSTLKEKLIEIDGNQLRKISALENPNQVVAVMNFVENQPTNISDDALYLDGIQIPNNVGAILRIAEWFQIKNIILSPSTADIYSPKVIQASMGSFMRLSFEVVSPSDLRDRFPDHEIVVADGGGVSLKDFEFSTSSILVMGNEGHGPSAEVVGHADHVVSIDRVGEKYPESLNVGVATGILCNHWKG